MILHYISGEESEFLEDREDISRFFSIFMIEDYFLNTIFLLSEFLF